MIKPFSRCIPTPPPGFVFFTNVGAYNPETKVNYEGEQGVADYFATRYRLPRENILVLTDATPCGKYSVFLHESHSAWVEKFHEAVQIMLEGRTMFELMRRVFEEEEID